MTGGCESTLPSRWSEFCMLERSLSNCLDLYTDYITYEPHLESVQASASQNIAEDNWYIRQISSTPLSLRRGAGGEVQWTIEQRATTDYYTPYTFSAKERDLETGYSYFGARYYNSDASIWLSVDPMADKLPELTPYNYVANKPIIAVGPDGKFLNIIVGAVAGAAAEMTSHIASTLIQGGNLGDAFRTMDWYDVAILAGEGALIGSGLGAPLVLATKAGGALLRSTVDITKDRGIEIVGGEKTFTQTSIDFVSEIIGSGTEYIGVGKLISGKICDSFLKNGFKSGAHLVTGMITSDFADGLSEGLLSGLFQGLYRNGLDKYAPDNWRENTVLPAITVQSDTNGNLTNETKKRIQDWAYEFGEKYWEKSY
jgi:RHS repeat-associated protein